MKVKPDFSGYATKNDIRCSDGRTIMKDAFKECDGMSVPLIWQHDHDDPDNVLGHAILENREDGVYAYGFFNDNPRAQRMKLAVEHGDIDSMSIFANKLKQKAGNVAHGVIKELSLVIAGANPGAKIDYPMIAHGDEEEECLTEAIITCGEFLEHMSQDEFDEGMEILDSAEDDTLTHEDSNKEDKKVAENTKKDTEKTVQDVINSMTDEQKTVLYYMVGEAAKGVTAAQSDDDGENFNDGGNSEMKTNVFDQTETESTVMAHAEELKATFNAAAPDILKKAKSSRMSLRDTVSDYLEQSEEFGEVLSHADSDDAVPYGINNIDWLFPEARTLTNTPEFIKRNDEWVAIFMSGTKKTPFSRIKSVFADITADEARAKGYMKGNRKKEEVFGLLKRTTTPTTVYKKQKIDRDDVIDITDFDVVLFLKGEMRIMLNEEIARAALISDGRSAADEDKIPETNIRPILTDDDLYTIKYTIAYDANATAEEKASTLIDSAVLAAVDYEGSGNTTLFTTQEQLSRMLLLKDGVGRRLYANTGDLATAMAVNKIVTVPVMKNLTRTYTGTNGTVTNDVAGIIVDLKDYTFGADKGGAVSLFDDFDIDYNQMKYLIETRCSGALTKPKSAIVLEFARA